MIKEEEGVGIQTRNETLVKMDSESLEINNNNTISPRASPDLADVVVNMSNTEEDDALRPRAKYYKLNPEQGVWNAIGVGYIRYENSLNLMEDRKNQPRRQDGGGEEEIGNVGEGEGGESILLLISEEDTSKILLCMDISLPELGFARSVANIITWTENEEEFALSFEQDDGCESVWRKIGEMQKRPISRSSSPSSWNGGDLSEFSDYNHHDRFNSSFMIIKLEQPTRETISEFGSKLKMLNPTSYEAIHDLLNSGKMDALFELFQEAEKDPNSVENMVLLLNLFEISKTLCNLESEEMMEALISDVYFEKLTGMVEYDPSLPYKPDYRGALNAGLFNKVNSIIQVGDLTTLGNIRKRFRIGYLKDVLMPRVLEETAIQRLNRLDSLYLKEIVSFLVDEENTEKNLQRIYDKLNEDNFSLERENAMLFLTELCGAVRTQMMEVKRVFFDRQMKFGLMGLMLKYLSNCAKAREAASSLKEMNSACEILSICLRYYCDVRINFNDLVGSSSNNNNSDDGMSVLLNEEEDDFLKINVNPTTTTTTITNDNNNNNTKKQLLQEDDNKNLLSVLIGVINADSINLGIKTQCIEVLTSLLDPELFSTKSDDFTRFLELFYGDYASKLLLPITNYWNNASEPTTTNGNNDLENDLKGQTCYMVVTLFANFTVRHTYFIRSFLMYNDLLGKIMKLCFAKDKYIVLVAIRFLRNCLSANFDFYSNYIMKHDQLKGVVDCFVLNGAGEKDNLIDSVTFELLQFVADLDENKENGAREFKTYVLESFKRVGEKKKETALLSGLLGEIRGGGDERKRIKLGQDEQEKEKRNNNDGELVVEGNV